MKFAFFASSLVSAYWNGAATYYRGIVRHLHARGHEIVFFEPDAYDRQKHRDIPDPDWAEVVVYDHEDRDDTARCLERAGKEADIVVKCSGVGVLDAFLEAAVLELRGANNRVIYWDVDAPATLERMRQDPEDRLRKLVGHYDYVFTYGGGEPVIRAFEDEFEAKRCIPIYNALDPDTHHPVEPRADWQDVDLSFMGNRLPDREARVEEFFLRAAAALPEHTFLLGGNGWGDKPMSDNIRYMGHVYTRDHNAFNCSPRAVLNISRESMASNGFSPATRVFEAAGAAACLITDAWEGIEQFLEPDREVLVAHDGQEVARHLEELDAERARAIGQAALERVLSEHTYGHRAAQVEQILGG